MYCRDGGHRGGERGRGQDKGYETSRGEDVCLQLLIKGELVRPVCIIVVCSDGTLYAYTLAIYRKFRSG